MVVKPQGYDDHRFSERGRPLEQPEEPQEPIKNQRP